MEYTTVSAPEFAALERVDEWRFILGAIRATFSTGSFPAASSFVADVTAAAERLVHHPDIGIRYPGDVDITVMTHATGGLTTLDVDLAREISAIADRAGHAAKPADVQATELGIDTMDADRIRPFWAAILDYRVGDEHGSLVDPRRQGWSVWFQQMDEPRTERNRLHLDVAVPHDVAEQRIAAALAAGGTLVSDQRAKAFWVLADPEGNEVCICTWQDRH